MNKFEGAYEPLKCYTKLCMNVRCNSVIRQFMFSLEGSVLEHRDRESFLQNQNFLPRHFPTTPLGMVGFSLHCPEQVFTEFL